MGLGLAITSVLVSPIFIRLWGHVPTMAVAVGTLIVVMATMSLFVTCVSVLLVCIAMVGCAMGIMNTALTEAVMETTDLPRGIASSAYSGVRFIGSALCPAISGPLAAVLGARAPFQLAVITAAIALTLLLVYSGRISRGLSRGTAQMTQVKEAVAVTVGDEA